MTAGCFLPLVTGDDEMLSTRSTLLMQEPLAGVAMPHNHEWEV